MNNDTFDWCKVQIGSYAGGGHKDGLYAEMEIHEYQWNGPDVDTMPDDVEHRVIPMVRADIHDELRAMCDELATNLELAACGDCKDTPAPCERCPYNIVLKKYDTVKSTDEDK